MRPIQPAWGPETLFRYVPLDSPDAFFRLKDGRANARCNASTYALKVGMFSPQRFRIVFALPKTARTPQMEPSFLFFFGNSNYFRFAATRFSFSPLIRYIEGQIAPFVLYGGKT
jgi:hypothetical protein